MRSLPPLSVKRLFRDEVAPRRRRYRILRHGGGTALGRHAATDSPAFDDAFLSHAK